MFVLLVNLESLLRLLSAERKPQLQLTALVESFQRMSGGNYNRRHLALALTTGLIAAPVLSWVWNRWKKYVRKFILKNEPQTLFDEEICDTQDFVQEDDDSSRWTSLGFEEPLVIAMVGLPARGKSYISKMLMVLPNLTFPLHSLILIVSS